MIYIFNSFTYYFMVSTSETQIASIGLRGMSFERGLRISISRESFFQGNLKAFQRLWPSHNLAHLEFRQIFSMKMVLELERNEQWHGSEESGEQHPALQNPGWEDALPCINHTRSSDLNLLIYKTESLLAKEMAEWVKMSLHQYKLLSLNFKNPHRTRCGTMDLLF